MPFSAPPPSRRPSFAAAVFDLDGTLIDSADDIGRSLNRLLAEFGRPALSNAAVRAMLGDGSTELVRQAFAADGAPLTPEGLEPAVARYLEIYFEQAVDSGCLFPGVRETLERFADSGMRLGLCTNKAEHITLKILEALDLARLFDVVAGGDTLPVRKPDPKPLLWVLDRLGVLPSAAVMVGDNRNDVLAARAAGMPVVVLSYGYPRMPVVELGADRVLDRFADLPAVLEQLRPPAPVRAPR
jgi:phosphoglycolate phosphatase